MSLQNYDLRFYDAWGNKKFSFDAVIELDYGRQKNDIGAASLLLPGDLYNVNDFGEDYLLEIWRVDNNSDSLRLVGDTIYLLRKIEFSLDSNGNQTIELVFKDTIDILRRRYNAWLLSELTDYPSHMNRPIVDQIIQVFDHNFGANTAAPKAFMLNGPQEPVVGVTGGIGAAARRMNLISSAGIPAGINATAFDVEMDWENCLDIFQKLANISENRNIPVWFDIVYSPMGGQNIGSFAFKVWEGQRGTNRANPNAANYLAFSPELGNLSEAKLVLDYEETIDSVIAIGDETAASDATVGFDEVLQGAAFVATNKPFQPIELVVEERKTAAAGSLVSLAQATLAELRPIEKLTGDVISLPGYQFGSDFFYGDVVAVSWQNLTFSAEITKFSVQVNQGGESVTIPIESTTLIT